MKRALVLSVVAGALALSGALAGDEPGKASRDPQAAPAKSIADANLSLYPGSLFEVPDPAGFSWNDDEPGDGDRLARAFPIAPPRIPHDITGFMPVTLSANACLECHALDAGADAPELPPSHRTDLRHSPDKVGATVAGARYLCLACHVPTTDAPPARTSRLPRP
jgi:cytochrome c-type protein NapB